MPKPLPTWVVEAARWPLAFAQVREDPLIDLWVARQIGPGARIFMIASGGCTAALLAARANARSIHLVDPNPAQLALARLKLHFLRAPTPARLGIFGHLPLDRQPLLAAALAELGLPKDILGPLAWVAERGPDHAGRYERVFEMLRERLGTQLDAVLDLHDPADQGRRVAPVTPLGEALDAALDEVMALSHLVALFGEGATRNRVEPFARHFARRTRHACATLPAGTNPYLWQMYRGCYPPGTPVDWFLAAAPSEWPAITWSKAFMTEALAQVKEPVDFVHLSNILDWLSPDEARATLDLAAAVLKPGGWLVIRQLNSTLDIPAQTSAFAWQNDQAERLQGEDRSFFYRALHLGRKR